MRRVARIVVAVDDVVADLPLAQRRRPLLRPQAALADLQKHAATGQHLDSEATDWLLHAATDYGLEVLRVRPENIPGLSNRSHTFWYDDPWVSSDVLITLLLHLAPDKRGLARVEGPSGSRYWTFMPDYPEQLAKVMARLRHEGEIPPPATQQ